ncbi:MAG: trypsin-like peptidase domain-containing protein [Alphaproteobacteria bacterium]|nr:trypsin-like peptidase domain-containing protein [Alphaproteobacteria bacterium]
MGDWVVAIGNPFGLIDTTTAGVVSSLNRNVSGPYGDIIQTDAAINKGNSGGALFNSFGEVVGVNTAIYSPNGGSVGIGFSVPSNRVLKIAETIIAHGDIKHGWLGIAMADLTAEMGGKSGSGPS